MVVTACTRPAKALDRKKKKNSTEEGTQVRMNPTTDEDQLAFDRNWENKRQGC